jgi:branched-chain amino acid transport system permease protein
MKTLLSRVKNLDERSWYLILVIMTILFPIIVGSNRWIQVANFFFIYSLLGLSLNIILGYAGLFQLGHAAFYAVGAYTTAILSSQFDIPVLLLLPLSGLLATLLAVLISRPILHLHGDYLCIVTIGFGEIVRIALRNDARSLTFLAKAPGLAFLKEKLETVVVTGGPNGIMGIGRPGIPVGPLAETMKDAAILKFFGLSIKDDWLILRDQIAYFYLFLAFVAFTVFAMRRLENSRLGRAWTCVREDEIAAEAMGIDTVRAKLLAFALGAAWAGVTGGLYASWITVIAPESFGFWESVIMFCIVVLGGTGSIPGVFVGTIGMIVLPELLREILANVQQWRMLVFGAAMISMMVFRPEGLWPSAGFRRELEAAREEATTSTVSR